MNLKILTRRDVIKWSGALVAGLSLGSLETFLSGCREDRSVKLDPKEQQGATPGQCLQATNTTRGPYFVDNADDPNIENDVVDPSIPERSDITTDTEGSAGKQPGLPLNLKLVVGSYNGGTCAPISQARVDIWHCNAQGVYSDVQTMGGPPPGVGGTPGAGAPPPIGGTSASSASTVGQNFLRGYQMTDSNGQVTFITIYPGWYQGRTVHIHIKIRIYDSSGNVTTEATTQLFFNDSTSDAVFAANSAYSRTAARDTSNNSDSIFLSESPALLVNLTGSSTAGYTGNVTLGIQTGQIFGG